MKRFTNDDIEKMLNKTEKTDPAFDKSVSFPHKRPHVVRRTNWGRSLLVACLLILSVVTVSVIVMPNFSTVPDYNDSQQGAGFASNTSDIISVNESTNESYVFNSSFDFSDYPDEERSTAATESDMSYIDESSATVVEPIIPEVNYPKNTEVFNDDVISVGQSVEDYFALNPFEHLGGKIRLNVYERLPCDTVYYAGVVTKINAVMGTEFAISEGGSFGDFTHINFEDRNVGSLELGKYGDWELLIYDTQDLQRFASTDSVASDAKAFTVAIKGDVANSYLYETVAHEDGLTVYVKEISNINDSIMSNMPLFIYDFTESSYGEENNLYLSKVTYNAPGESIGSFKTALYDSAVIKLLDQTSSEFIILGHDVRYITHNTEASVCPYFAFVIKINPYKESSYVTTVFIPAIEDVYIIK